MLTMLFAIAALGTARADEVDCVECCKDKGLVSCPTRLRVFGDGSLATREAGGWRVIGLWWLDCADGASFQSGGTVVVPYKPRPGEILLSGYPPTMMPCFREHCVLPHGACLVQSDSGTRYQVSRCVDGQPLSEAEMRTPAATSPAVNEPDTTGSREVPNDEETAVSDQAP